MLFPADQQCYGADEWLSSLWRLEQQHVGLVPRLLRAAPAPQAPRALRAQLRLPRVRRGPPVR